MVTTKIAIFGLQVVLENKIQQKLPIIFSMSTCMALTRSHIYIHACRTNRKRQKETAKTMQLCSFEYARQ